jgi:hypothetical protein
VSFATGSGKVPLPQLQPYRSQGHRGTGKAVCLYGEKRTLTVIKAKLRQRMHEQVNAVGAWLKRVVSGYYRYHAVPENQRALWRFRDRLCDLWRSMLGRRSQRSRPVGRAFARPSNDGYHVLVSCILFLTCVSTPIIQGRSRVR